MPQILINVVGVSGQPYTGSMVVYPITLESRQRNVSSPAITIDSGSPQLGTTRTTNDGSTRTTDDGSTRTIDSATSTYTLNLNGGSYKLVIDLVDTIFFRVPSIGGPFNLTELIEV